jgi:hypothetical protein
MSQPGHRAALAAALAVAPWVGHAGAQTDPVAARVLFSDARNLTAQGKYDQACPKFEESQRLDPGIGTLFNLADCWEHVGRTASAWGRFLDVAAQAKMAGQADREKVARERAAMLEPKLSRLTIEVPSKEAGLEVRRDDIAIGAAIWGSSIPVDPGAHTIEARAPGKKVWQQTVQVAEGGAKLTITIPSLEEDRSAPALAPQAATSIDSGGGTGKTIGYALIGVGVVGVAAGTVFGLQAKSKNDDALGICQDTPTTCPDEQIQAHTTAVDDAHRAVTLSVVGFAAGGAALVGGVILLATTKGERAKATAVDLTPLASSHGGGLAVSGRW